MVCRKRGVERLHVSKRSKTRRETEKEPERLQGASKSRRKPLGVGFVQNFAGCQNLRSLAQVTGEFPRRKYSLRSMETLLRKRISTKYCPAWIEIYGRHRNRPD